MKTLIQDLLTENRYWTFWSLDWTTHVNVFWEGKTKWTEVKSVIAEKYFKNVDFGYERQVSLTEPDIKFD